MLYVISTLGLLLACCEAPEEMVILIVIMIRVII